MRTRTKITYKEAIAWMVEHIYFPGSEDRGLREHVCVQYTAHIFRRKAEDVANEICLTYVQKTTSEKHHRRSGLKLVKDGVPDA